MLIANENLRHGASTGDIHHVFHGFWVLVNANFFDGGDTFVFQNAFGSNAVGADGGGLHFYSLHGFIPRYPSLGNNI